MTRRQCTIAVEARADVILAGEPSVEAYAAYFETQMHRAKVRRLLHASYLWFARAGTILTGLGLAAGRRRPGKRRLYEPLSGVGRPASRLQGVGQALAGFARRLITTTGAGTT